MKVVGTLLAIAAVTSTSAFLPKAPLSKSSVVLPAEQADVSRRSALLSIGGVAAAAFATAVSSPNPAFAEAGETSEEMVARIAAKSAGANEAARLKREKDDAAREKGKEGSGIAVLGVGAAGVALTAPFFLPNLLRLGTKLSSGGEDDGYGR